MGTYLQIGHEGWNLLEEPIAFQGIVLSPVNDSPIAVSERMRRLGGDRSHLEVVFDPQLYNPASSRGQLSQWRYFPTDLDTADLSSTGWWLNINRSLVACAAQAGSNVVCSPASVPRSYAPEYYAQVVAVADNLAEEAATVGLQTAVTLIVRLSDLAAPARALEISSIISAAGTDRAYLVLVVDGVEPRQQVVDAQLLATAVHLVKLLAQHMRVHIAFAAQDLLLWKAAGAQDVSSGKFLNLRRFSPARWTTSEEGGRMVPYWTEPSLLALIRDADVLTLRQRGLYGDGVQLAANPYSQRILDILLRGTGEAWVSLAWRQYLHWFTTMEADLVSPHFAQQHLQYVDATWQWLHANGILLLDHWNDGSWVRVWRNALADGLNR